MISVAAFIGGIIAAYLFGSIPTGFIAARIFKGVDIRSLGSKNVGATNVYRVAGKLPGLLTLLVDIGKGIIVVTVVASFTYSYIENIDFEFYRALLGLIAICGHIWTVFLGFKGGKGVATTIGVFGVIAPVVLLVSLGIWLIVFLATNYVSLASIMMGLSLPITACVFSQSFYVIIFSVTICVINSYKHNENIKRLLKGEESKTILFKNS